MSAHTAATGVSIGVPVHNAERYLEGALDALLGQTHADLEIIVCDNASTDATEEIARRFATTDSRVVYHRNRKNLGAPRNFNVAFQFGTRPYFKWASNDDLHHPEFVQACVEFLETHPEHVVAFTDILIIDDDGAPLKRLPNRLRHLEDPRVDRRLGDITRPAYGCFHVWGVMRRAAILRTRLHGPYPGSDRVFLAEMALQGKIATIPRELFYLRSHRGRSVKSLPTIYTRAAWHDPAKRGIARLPNWRVGAEYLVAIDRADLSPGERLRSIAQIARWTVRDWNWAKLALDLVALVSPGVPRLYLAGRRWVRASPRRRWGRSVSDAEELG